MTDPVVSSYPGYATPTFTRRELGEWIDYAWDVTAEPWQEIVGRIFERGPGWVALTSSGRRVGLFPDKQAAGEALVKHAGYEVLR